MKIQGALLLLTAGFCKAIVGGSKLGSGSSSGSGFYSGIGNSGGDSEHHSGSGSGYGYPSGSGSDLLYPSGYKPSGYKPTGYNPSGYNPSGYNPSGYNTSDNYNSYGMDLLYTMFYQLEPYLETLMDLLDQELQGLESRLLERQAGGEEGAGGEGLVLGPGEGGRGGAGASTVSSTVARHLQLVQEQYIRGGISLE